MASVLVTGGAGYIGSHTTLQLAEAGHEVVVLDNLYSGHRWAVHEAARFVEGNIGDRAVVSELLASRTIDAIVHFAGHIVVPESVANPLKYYDNNVAGSLNLLQCAIEAGVGQFVFSSSAAVYGIPASTPVNEEAATSPINPYGATKLITEWTLSDLANAADDFRYVALRYFNVAGADRQGRLGQATPEATHLIKVACEAATGKRDGMSIFGDDYETTDGTCVRDYIHVEDLARAHLRALDYLKGGGESTKLNCGYGKGYSVTQVVEMVKRVSGVDFPVRMEGRRDGDPAELVADNKLVRRVLGWQPELDDLETICRSALEWERKMAARGQIS